MALVLPALAGCGSTSHDKEMADKLAAAQQAADRAVAAQHAAEKAAVDAANAHSQASAPEVVSDNALGSINRNDGMDGGNQGGDTGAPALSMGGPGQTVAPDGTVIPGV